MLYSKHTNTESCLLEVSETVRCAVHTLDAQAYLPQSGQTAQDAKQH